jgi:hypothetical protein
MKRIIKYVTISLFSIVFLFFLFLFGGRRRSLKSVYNYEIEFSKNNAANVQQLVKYVAEKKLIPGNGEKIFIGYAARRSENISITYWKGNAVIEKYETTPGFIPFLCSTDLSVSIKIENDGVVFTNMFSTYNLKKCSFKYFNTPHHLLPESIYKGIYSITTFEKINNFSNSCCIIDSNWILLISPDKF